MLNQLLQQAKDAQKGLRLADGSRRNQVLAAMRDLLRERQTEILAVNQAEVQRAEAAGLTGALLKRLVLTEKKLAELADGLKTVARLPDPLGQGPRWTLDNGLKLNTVRVPLGVIGLIFESRPGVAIEAAGLTVKSGNAIILRSGHEALDTVTLLTRLWQDALERAGLPRFAVQSVEKPDRQYAVEMMHLTGLDLLIPRGGAGLIQTVVKEATVPVIETGVGNCHLYVDKAADLDMAVKILRDGKVGNPAVCNALETVLVHRDVKEAFLTRAYAALEDDGVTWHGDPEVRRILPQAVAADEPDWANEYLSLDLAAKVVDGLEEALAHIERYGTFHSEAVVTNDYVVGQTFLERVDAAVVYWNASTRFTDGFQFGFGAEVGISTQKMHARGPMGLEALTTTKTLAYGMGQTRDLH
ncbi:gamma-glutamyl phosphate reductase [Sulfobacillus acidophilus TPY]|uniref:Gamma-glutamyl phosphate reductase n=1 Tax=Sulfobacillus acidophilus (strain ATCC 700253 / DSM 10332 / NAL) TaxID=679936 RepID=G8TS35_SULAD|nr:gamma-glutamyl phosphate reductase [Sulfobacillus acidophilus TPY]AEW04361.1 glutamate-5-semialdehyde dehydrogenase [Sulfobacillus acidophilus DSM 10332]